MQWMNYKMLHPKWDFREVTESGLGAWSASMSGYSCNDVITSSNTYSVPLSNCKLENFPKHANL